MENKDLSSIENGQLSKSRNFLFANLANKMTATQNVLFSLALLHAKVDDDDYAYATFTKEDVEKFIKDEKFAKSRKDRILKDMAAVGTNSILLYDEKMMTDPRNGKFTGILVFAQYSYDAGTYYFTFNTSRVLLGDQLATPILEILKRDEVNPIVYNLSTFANLTFSGQVLYEQILIATNNDKRSMFYSLADLKKLFGATGKSMDRFNGLKNTHLIPAIDSINKFADIGVLYDEVKQSRKITGVKIFWTFEKVNIPASKNQVKVAHELYTELSLLKIKDKELLKKLQQIEKCVISEAADLIQKAIEVKKEHSEKIKKEKENEENLQKAIKAKREKELEKDTETTKTEASLDIIDFPEIGDFEAVEVEEVSYLEPFFATMPYISEKFRAKFIELSKLFPEKEVVEMFKFAQEIRVANGGNSLEYTIRVIENWLENGVETLAEAVKFQIENYNYKKAQEKASKSKSKAKKESKSNVPGWSNPDYKNETSEETKVLLEAKKQELLSRLDKA
jgi:hypothetical protein